MKLHPDIENAGLRMKLAYEDWQDNEGDIDFKRAFERAREVYRTVKKRSQEEEEE
jgi:hypothetical protein